MLIAEYDYATDIAVQRAEAGRIAFANGIEQGKSLGLAEGKSLGLAEGSRQAKLETAKNLLDIGLSVESILKATGLRSEEIANL